MTALAARLLTIAPLLFMVALGTAGCGDRAPDGSASEEEAGAPLPLDGEGMEPRIVTEHPVDAPGRPVDDRTSATAVLEAAPESSWIPHLEVTDLEASREFYRGLGFTVTGREPENGPARRLELSREGARLVLVAAEPPTTPAGDSADGDAPAPTEPGLVLHLVTSGDEPGERSVGDPDGHRLSVPGPD